MQLYKEKYNAEEEKRQLIKQREKESREANRKDALNEECTFHPQINDTSASKGKRTEVYKRLYQDVIKRKAKRETMMKEIEEKQKNAKPEISKNAAAAKPKYMIIESPQEKQQKIEELKKRDPSLKDETFKPTIDKKSAKLAKKKEKDGPRRSVYENLYVESKVIEEKKKEKVAEEQKRARRNSMPIVNVNAKSSVKGRPFLDRLRDDIERRNEHRRMVEMREKEKGPKGRRMTEEERKAFIQRQQEYRILREQKIRELRDEKDRLELGEVTGKPKINKGEVSSNIPVYDRLYKVFI